MEENKNPSLEQGTEKKLQSEEKVATGTTSKRKWTSYIKEFFMIFFAITLGFYADNLREEHNNKKTELVYMQNLLEDLKTDTSIYDDYAKNNVIIYALIDSLVVNLNKPERKLHVNKLAYWGRIMTAKWFQVHPIERTYDQMKSTGHLRLIRNRKVAEGVSYYYNSLYRLESYNEVGMIWAADYAKALGKIFDGEVLLKIIKERKEQDAGSSALLTEDRIILNELMTSAGYFYGALILAENIAKERNIAAKELINLIQKEYKLE
jgi:hypothetical protein